MANVPGIFVLGDCNGRGAFTNTAYNDHEIVAANLVIHSILDVMYAKAAYTVIQRAMHIHPTVTELIPTMLGDLSRWSE